MPRGPRLEQIHKFPVHHVLIRAANKQRPFALDGVTSQSNHDQLHSQHCRTYLKMLKQHSNRNGLKVLGYCLMPDHVHLLVVPEGDESLQATMHVVSQTYAKYFNNHQLFKTPKLWERYRSKGMDNEETPLALGFIEQNPLRVFSGYGGVSGAKPWDYRWSSARSNCECECKLGLLDFGFSKQFISIGPDWAEWVDEQFANKDTEPVRIRLKKGRPRNRKA